MPIPRSGRAGETSSRRTLPLSVSRSWRSRPTNDDKDTTPQLTKIRSANPDAVTVWATGPGQAIAVKNYRQLGLTAPLYLSHAANDFNFLRLAGGAADDILIPSSKIYVTDSLKDSDPQNAVLSSFVRDYQPKYGKPPATFAGNAYDACWPARHEDPGIQPALARHR